MTAMNLETFIEKGENGIDAKSHALEAALEHKVHCLKVLNQFALTLIDIRSSEELAWYVVKEVVGRLGFVDCVFYELAADEGHLVQCAAIGDKNPSGRMIANQLTVPLDQGITGRVAKTRQPLVIADLEQETDYLPDLMAARSEICVPLIHDGAILGVIDCEDPRPNHFTHEHLEFLTTVAAMASAKLDQCRMIEQLELQAQILKRVREAILVIDMDGTVIRLNEGAMGVLGYEPDELLGQSLARLAPDEATWRRDREHVLEIVDSKGVWRGQGEVLRGTGERMMLDMSITGLLDEYGNRIATILVGREAVGATQADDGQKT